MISAGKFFLLLNFIISLTQAMNWWETGIGLLLDGKTFDEHVGKDKHVIVEFFAYYCGYCRRMQPQWDLLAEHYMGDNSNRKDIIIAKLDGNVEKQIARRYAIPSYPTIIFFKKNEIFPTEVYYNSRDVRSFIDWIERLAGPEEVKKENIIQAEPELEPKSEPDELKSEPEPEQINEIEKDDTDFERKLALPISDGDVDTILEKLDYIIEFVVPKEKKTGTPEPIQDSNDIRELKMVLDELNLRMEEKEEASKEGVNFTHGISFLIFGIFIGIGISFTFVNYKKLEKAKKIAAK